MLMNCRVVMAIAIAAMVILLAGGCSSGTATESTPPDTVLEPLAELDVAVPASGAGVDSIENALALAGAGLALPIPADVPDDVRADTAQVRVSVTGPSRVVVASIAVYAGEDVVVSVQTSDHIVLPCQDGNTGTDTGLTWTPTVFRGVSGCTADNGTLTFVRWIESGRTFEAETHTDQSESNLAWLNQWELSPA